MSRLRREILVVGVAGVLLGAMGCQRVTLPQPVKPQGRSAFEFVTPPAPTESKAKITEAGEPAVKDSMVPPRAEGTLVEPSYPAPALAAREGPVTLGLRIVVGVDGRVLEMGSSLLTFSTPTRFEAEFRAAVEAAVAQWKFRPAEVRHFAEVTNRDGTYRSLVSREKTEWALHVTFTFKVSGGAADSAK